MLVPPKETVTGTVPEIWFTLAMLHEAAPEASVVAVQLWAEEPDPSVSVTDWPFSGVPLLVSVVDSVSDDPSVVLGGPV